MSTTKRRKARNPKRRHPGTPTPVTPSPSWPPSIVIVSNGDDWEGLYINGEVMRQNHRLDAADVLSALGIELEKRWVSSEYLGETVGQLPDKLSDIPKEAWSV